MDEPDDLHELERALLDGIRALTLDPSAQGAPPWLGALFTAQVQSRVLDHTARWLRAAGKGFYTIGSAGHESNAAVAAALRPTDPALLHYRSGGFYCARAQQRPGHDPVREACRRTRDVPLPRAVGFLPMRRRPCPSRTHRLGEER